MSLLEITDLSVQYPTRFGTFTAIDGIDLTLAPGEIHGLVGESGAGKSTIGQAVIGLIPSPGFISNGDIKLQGESLIDLAQDQYHKLRGDKISMIFQDPQTSLNPLLTIGRQLIESIRNAQAFTQSEAAAEALRLLEIVGIPHPEERLKAYPHELSGGMRQRVVIALALCAEPSLIIADEPTTALDVSVQAQIIALLKRLCRERGTAVMLITHDMGVIAETADRVAVMYAGRLAELGPVRDVITSPEHPYTDGLMGSTPLASKGLRRLRQIPGSMPRLTAMPDGCAFHPRCPKAQDICRTDPRPRREGGRAACHFPIVHPAKETL